VPADDIRESKARLSFYLNDKYGVEYDCALRIAHGEWVAYGDVCGGYAAILTCKTLGDLCKGLNTLNPRNG
jgi:hypothetical protein